MLPPTRKAIPPNIFFSLSPRSVATSARILSARSSSYTTVPKRRQRRRDAALAVLRGLLVRRPRGCQVEVLAPGRDPVALHLEHGTDGQRDRPAVDSDDVRPLVHHHVA